MPGAAGGILSYFVRHRTAANLLLVLMLVAGAAAAPNMRAQFFPDVIVDNVDVAGTQNSRMRQHVARVGRNKDDLDQRVQHTRAIGDFNTGDPRKHQVGN